MLRDELESGFRELARSLSPTKQERQFIASIYASIESLLGSENCLQIGSYPRYTSIRPLHDLDMLFVLGEEPDESPDSEQELKDLYSKLFKEYDNPTEYSCTFDIQSHSVSISFLDKGDEVFSVDILPSYIFGQNEFGLDMYLVPEILEIPRYGRGDYYSELTMRQQKMGWIKTDPRGYIKIASDIDSSSGGNFRKAVKLVKYWKSNLVDADETIEVKSFHVEQIVTRFFSESSDVGVVDGIFYFFQNLPSFVSKSNQFPDRGDPQKFIDNYIEDLSNEQIEKVVAARDNFLIKLETVSEPEDIDSLFEVGFYYRSPSEQFLFDSGIMTFTDSSLIFEIDGYVRPLSGFSSGWLRKSPPLRKGLTQGIGKTRFLDFSVSKNNSRAEEIWWKVRNSDNCEQPRGEITVGQTKNVPEHTKYPGTHYVEGYAIIDDVCVAKSRINVKII